MPKNTGYDNPAEKGMAGDPPGGKAAPGPKTGYSDANQDGGKTKGPEIGKTGSKGSGYDQAGIGADTSRGGFSKRKRYPG